MSRWAWRSSAAHFANCSGPFGKRSLLPTTRSSPQPADNFSVLVFGIGSASLRCDIALGSGAEQRFSQRCIIGGIDDGDHVVLSGDHVEILHFGAGGFESLARGIKAGGTISDVLKPLLGPFEKGDVGGHCDGSPISRHCTSEM